MPTPFYHLSVVKELLEHPALSASTRQILWRERAAFFFGSTAPDVQTVSRQARGETHFFDLPLKANLLPPWEVLFISHPELAKPAILDNAHAAFILGYILHLQADWKWVREIYVPYFGKQSQWGTFSHRLYLHNVLRIYLDQEILPKLLNGNPPPIRDVTPSNWLPFVEDDYLVQWRDLLAEQLQPGAMVRSVEIFASRQGISPDEYYRLLSSEEHVEAEIFTHFPREKLQTYRLTLLEENLQLIEDYLQGSFRADNSECREDAIPNRSSAIVLRCANEGN